MIRRIGALCLLAVMICGAALMPAEGLAEIRYAAEYDSTQGASNVYISGLKGNTEYAFMILETAGEITAEKMLYLDQVKSSSTGMLHLAFIQTGTDGATLALGGSITGESSPYILGQIAGAAGGKMTSPSGLTEIGEEAFAGSQFMYVYIGSKVRRIGKKAFAGCTGLKSVHIPDSVTEIADDAFSGCSGFVIICSEQSEACAYAVRKNIPYIPE